MQEYDDTQGNATGSSMLAMSVALDHPVITTNPTVLCAAARTCKAWTHAVRQCGACTTAIVIDPKAPVSTMLSFSCWLFRHAPLVRSISSSIWNTHPDSLLQGLSCSDHIMAEQQLLQAALQLVTAQQAQQPTATPTSAAPGRLAASLLHRRQQRRWRLASFSSNCFVSPPTLAALPSHSLTHLDIDYAWCVPELTSAAALSEALARLSSLQQLRVASTRYKGSLPGACLDAVTQLSRLTSLTLDGAWELGQNLTPLRQLLESPLPLLHLQLHVQPQVAGRNVQGALPPANMAGLAQLQEFSSALELHRDLALPAQLQHLQLGSCRSGSSLQPVLRLQQLQHLQLKVDIDEQPPLLALAQLPALQHLALEYTRAATAAAAAGGWGLQPKLSALTLQWVPLQSTTEQMDRILAGVAAATSLTKLDLPAAESSDGARICASLTGLKSLRDLRIRPWINSFVHHVSMLATLTGLTRLALPVPVHIPPLNTGSAAQRDAPLTALLARLPQLQHLNLQGCDVQSVETMAAIGQLVQLTELRLEGSRQITEQGLMQLTGLKHLKQLGVDRTQQVTDEVVTELWAAVRRR